MPPLTPEQRKRLKADYDDMAEEEKGSVGKVMQAVAAGFEAVTPPSPFGLAQHLPTPSDLFAPSSFMGELGHGVAKGMTAGASEEVPNRMVQALGLTPPPEPQGIVSFAGELLGEITGPYRMAQQFLMPLRTTGMGASLMGRFPQVAATAEGGLASGLVEGIKGGIKGENPLEHFATGLTIGAAFEGGLRGAYKGGKRLAERFLGPDVGEVNEKLVGALEKHDIPVIPTVVRPFSNMVQYMQNKVTQTTMTRSTLQTMRADMVRGIDRLRENTVMRLGDNAIVQTPLDVGEHLVESIDGAAKQLKDQASTLYKDVTTSEIRNVPIHPYQDFIRHLEDGTEHTTNLLAGMRDLLGEGLINNPRASHNAIQKRLRKVYLDIKKAHAPVEETVLQPMPQPGYKTVPRAVSGVSPLREAVAGGPRNVAPQQHTKVPNQTYQWWWNEVQAVGGMLSERAVKENPKMKSLVGSMYHLLQDGIDAQASAVSPNYNNLISKARASWSAYEAYQRHPLIKKVLQTSERDPEQALGILFGSTASIQQTKRLFGPEAFNTMRQAWLRDLLWDAIEKDADTGIEFVTGKKLTTRLNKFTHGIDSEFVRTMFSDDGFTNAAGDAIAVNTDAAAKLAMFKELYTITSNLDQAQKALKGGQELFGGSGVERGTLGTLLLSFAQGSARARGFMANLLLMRRGAKQYIKQPASKNIYLGGKLPEMGAGDVKIPLRDEPIPGEMRTQTTSALMNRLFGSSDEPE